MGKFGKNKIKALNKLAKKQNAAPVSNKILKKKQNAEKKVSFQKEVLLKEAVSAANPLVKTVKPEAIEKKIKTTIPNNSTQSTEVKKPKQKSVEKKKKRRKTFINDTKLLLSLMKKK